MITITPVDDGEADPADGVETIIVKSTTALKDDDEEPITITPATINLKDTGVKAAPEDPDDTTPKFTDEDILASDTAIEGAGRQAIEDVVLPEATGDGDLTYTVSSNLPAGLSFVAATRTISGTPTSADTTKSSIWWLTATRQVPTARR